MKKSKIPAGMPPEAPVAQGPEQARTGEGEKETGRQQAEAGRGRRPGTAPAGEVTGQLAVQQRIHTGPGQAGKGAAVPAPAPLMTRARPAPVTKGKELPDPQKKKKEAAGDERKAAPSFPIVGIGASAGGLEALEQFLGHVPEESGMAFVVVQHLDPTHKGIMPELLQRATGMTVLQVKDNTTIVPDHVYVIPPNKNLSILHGTLYLLEPVAPRGLRLPIDFFFRSLAEDQQDKSIGVILSGMGSDGTAGLRAIKEKAGIVFVQDPASAKFDGMPRSAIDADLADIVAPAEELPDKILSYIRYAPVIAVPGPNIEEKSTSSLAKIFVLLRERTKSDFSLYKKSSVYRRIERRMKIHQIDRIATYVRYLQENPGEQDLLFKELLIGVTSFFRDPAAWNYLRDKVLPDLLESHMHGTEFRAWVAGCSTGEEAYSLAIIFREALDKARPGVSHALQIFATDLDTDAIEKARQGFYPANIANDVSPERLSRFFSEEGKGYQIKKEVREMVIFATQNLIMDPPFTKLDLLICRNLLIYLDPALQKKIIPLFFYSLNPGGSLFLGVAETIGSFSNLFSPIESKLRLYRRADTFLTQDQVEFPVTFFPRFPEPGRDVTGRKTLINLQSLADQMILQQYSPPAVLANEKGDILYFSGRTGKYLEPAAGKANLNIFAMAREGLHYELTSAFQRAVRERGTVKSRNVRIRTNGQSHLVDITVQMVTEPRVMAGLVLIIFSDVVSVTPQKVEGKAESPARSRDARMTELEQELERRAEELRTVREEMQTSQEELRSTNEELQSANEELQSTNEELTTSKEEMQSLNEELQTVNAELQGRIEEFSRTTSDMKNLLNSTDIATLFLDQSLHIRRFTTSATKLIPLIAGDAGRPIADIRSPLLYPELETDATRVLDTLIYSEKDIPTEDGHWYRVRIMPYRTLENKIDGLVITFIDITLSKMAEQELIHARTFAEAILSSLRDPFLVLDRTMKVVVANPAFYQVFQVSTEETVGRVLFSLGDGQWDIPELRELVRRVTHEKAGFDEYIIRHTFPTIGDRIMRLNARPVIIEGRVTENILLAIEDITGKNGGPCP